MDRTRDVPHYAHAIYEGAVTVATCWVRYKVGRGCQEEGNPSMGEDHPLVCTTWEKVTMS